MTDYTRLRTPFVNMSFTPDVPSNALGPNEYSNGLNVEADVRGIKKVAGEQNILASVPGHIIFVEAGYRSETSFVYIVATIEGRWWMVTPAGPTNITPGYGADNTVSLHGGTYVAGNFVVGTCYTIVTVGTTDYTAIGASSNTVGTIFIATGVGSGTGTAISNYSDSTNITCSIVGGVFFFNDAMRNPMYFLPTATEMTITSNAQWNYESTLTPPVTSTTASFVRNYCSPNVGNILIAGNLTKVVSGTSNNYPTTIRWSQAFAQTGIPATWEPTLSNVANEQEVPVRGPIIDGFFLGGNFYVCSYWDTVVLSPIAYQNTTTPVFGVRLFNQGRGLINNNCWSNTDTNVYGVDSRDIWVFNGSEFAPLGNQKVRDYFFNNLSPTYSDRIFMVNNTQKNQIEIYYPDLTSTGWCNKMLSWRYDLQVWNAPRDVQNACMGTEAPKLVSGAFKLASRTVTYAKGGVANSQLVETGYGNSFSGAAINCLFERNNIVFQTPEGPVPYSSRAYVHRVLPEIAGTGNVNITIGGANSTAQTPVYGQTGTVAIVTDNPWVTTQQNVGRVVSIKVASNDATDTWNMTAMNWQASIVEDAF